MIENSLPHNVDVLEVGMMMRRTEGGATRRLEAGYLQQQQRQSAIQAQRPQQMQQMHERTSEATTEAMISQNHQTGRHSSEKYFRLNTKIF